MQKRGKTTELVRLFAAVLVVMLAVPLAYHVCVRIWPPDEKPRQTLTQSMEEDIVACCVKLLTKPVGDWSETEARLEPEIHAWLKEQGNEILPWEWTEEARRKDPKGYAKCWRRIWDDLKSRCEDVIEERHDEIGRLERESEALATVHVHRANQIARLRALASTNAFPCQVAVERLEKGRFWGWNKRVETVECGDASAVVAATNSICSREAEAAQGESRKAVAMAAAMATAKGQLSLYEQLCAACDRNTRLIESEPLQDEALKKSLVEVLKGTRR